MFPVITSLTYLPFAWTANNFIFLRNYKKAKNKKKTEILCFCRGHKTSLYWCTKVHLLVWFPSKLFIVMKTKLSYSLQNKPHYNIYVKSCVCFFHSFCFCFQFSGLIDTKCTLINLQLFSVVKKSARHKRHCVPKTVYFWHTPHLLTLGWLNFCRWSSLCW